ncbi:MAG: ATP-binding protein [Candidatus Jacksonbacteria bacterium]|nr:ATP-binding protein [Candidatus Jacksonbacteria bacterium]
MTFINREIVPKIKKHLKEKEVTLLLGPRQAGKTTIIKHLQEELEQDGQKTIYLSLDNFEERRYFTTQNALVKTLEISFSKSFVYVFIDEIQRLENAGLFLKGLYDMDLPYKFIVTGSGSLELKANVIESMTGRKRVFQILPLSFSEFTCYRTGFPADKIQQFFETRTEAGERLVNEYSVFGGYPRVVLSDSIEEKRAVLAEIYTSYIDKDVKALIGVEKDTAYQNLVRYLGGTVGNLINKAQIARTVGVTEKTVDQYLDILEKTFIIQLVRPFYSNITKELTKSPKAYFIDIGLRNYAAQNFQDFPVRADRGMVFENLVFTRFFELSLPFPVKFWRTQSGAEVDFVIEEAGRPVPIEAKSVVKPPALSRSFVSFLKKYHPQKAYIYSPNTSWHGMCYNTDITYLPYHLLPPLSQI